MGMELLLGSPLISIGVLAILAIVFDAMSNGNHKVGYYFSIFTLVLTGTLSAYTLTIPQDSITSLNLLESLSKGTLHFGGYSAILDIVFCLAGLLTIFASKPYILREGIETNEYYNLVLYSVSGMMIIAHSAHLLNIFIGVEIMSIAFYIMAGYFRSFSKSIESSLKYFILGSFATGFLVYGMAMVYGATGSMFLNIIQQSIVSGAANETYLMIGIGLMIVGLSFKVAAFPFHQWAPDVYTGAPTTVTAFMSTAGKAAALIAFIIIARALFPHNIVNESLAIGIEKARFAIAIIAAATMLVGNITALVQKNVKRMLAYSSVAHAGYLLMGIVANNETGWSGIIFYSTAYMFMQIGSFVIVSIFEKKQDSDMEIKDWAGMYKFYPVLSTMMALFMFSLAGIPPMAGFFGKFMLFKAAIQSGYVWLTVVAVISSIISMYFYIGLVVQMWFKEKTEGEELTAYEGSAKLTVWITSLAVIVLGIIPAIWDNLIKISL